MKKIDIDQLKRENIYHTPPNFLEEVQNNVFSKITENQKSEPKGKIIPLFWKYAVAAAIVLFVSIGGFWLINTSETKSENITTTNTKISKEEFIPNNISNNSVELSSENEKIPTEKIENTTTHLAKNTPTPKQKNIPIKQENINPSNIEENTEEILSLYTQNELAILTKEVQNDVYLDLFD